MQQNLDTAQTDYVALETIREDHANAHAHQGLGVIGLLRLVLGRWKGIVAGGVMAGGLGFGGAMLVPPTYLAQAMIMPPQQQNIASAAMSSLGALAGLTGGLGAKNTADQYVALMLSTSVSDRIIDRFKLQQVYDEDYRVDARKKLMENVSIAVGKKDGLITVDVEDRSPARAAEMANAYIEELRHMTNTLAVSEAQRRRQFFEQKLEETKGRLAEAQAALQGSGFSAGVLMAEPRAAADGYARLRSEAVAAEVKLQAMRKMLTDDAQEVIQQKALLAALRGELGQLEQKEPARGTADYINRYREYKYQETLFDLYAKQFELARADEGREGALIQVVDVATAPEKRHKPKRSLIALAAGVLAGLILSVRAVALGLPPRAKG
ncbi:Wzz/FepE/Etk N-terminal domain-containing protein [uncultured Sphaerotilus sp.]|uniref:Wzz/FepE/Etk N-terminal domain-containing protein n=1 Tax=uncultured Sphaerotilus sp. TaxID=474984 RepID=UPI0030CA3669